MGKVVDQIAVIRSTVGLVDYALGQGWTRDKEKSSNRVSVLRSGGDKIIVTMGRGHHEIFKSLRDDGSHGDVVDFVMWSEGKTLQEALESLGGYEEPPLPSGSSNGSTGATRGSRSDVVSYWHGCRWIAKHGYLRRRGLDAALGAGRFADCYRMDGKGNAVFPHVDRQGVCGAERRNVEFKGMQSGSIKGLWLSANVKTAKEILIAESPIDCMSHFELFSGDFAYCSLGGEISEYQFSLVEGLITKAIHRQVKIVVGTDNDDGGNKYYQRLQSLSSVELERAMPTTKDWNSDLSSLTMTAT